jgi:hypothetical protein
MDVQISESSAFNKFYKRVKDVLVQHHVTLYPRRDH